MAFYRNGIATREMLYSSARRNFAAQGYSKASVKNIVDDAHSKLGLFTYYFDSKESLALQILFELRENIFKEAAAFPAVLALQDNPLALDLVHVRLWIRALHENPSMARFARELCISGTHLDRISNEFHALWAELHPGKVPDDQDELNCMIVVGVLSQFSFDISTLNLTRPFEDALDYVLTQGYRLFVGSDALLADAVALSRSAVNSVSLEVDGEFNVRRI